MPSTPPRLCHAGFAPEQNKAGAAAARAAELGFSHIVFGANGAVRSGEPEPIGQLVEACAAGELEILLDLEISELPLDHPLVHLHPECFTLTAQGCGEYVDPRTPNSTRGCAIAHPQQNPEAFIAWWTDMLSRLSGAGVRGFRVLEPQICGGQVWGELIARLRQRNPAQLFVADTSRLAQHDVSDLRQAGFDFCLSALPWWNGRAPWLVEQHAPASRIAPVIALVEAPEHEPPAATELRRTRLAEAAVTGAGVMMPLGYETASLDGEPSDLSACVRAMNAIVESEIAGNGALRSLTGPGDPITVLLRTDAPDERIATRGLALMINPHHTLNAEIGSAVYGALGEWTELEAVEPFAGGNGKLAPGETRLLRARRSKPIILTSKTPAAEARVAARESRLVIANISPSVDGGAYAVKRIAGESIRVEADIFPDGHPVIAVELVSRAEDERIWQREPMQALGNDRWCVSLSLKRVGRYRFAIEAWWDVYGSFTRDLAKKHSARVDVALDIEEGRQLIEKAREQANKPEWTALTAILDDFEKRNAADRIALLVAPDTVEAMRRADPRPWKALSRTHSIEVERKSARFSSWYELFPRSQTDDAGRHGTFADVVKRLPAIAEMGFDVLYLTPIHPIGRINRKGRNNSLDPAKDDPGSPYAIGAREGGHTAIHPQLGTLADFHALVAAAHEHGLEIALDFAIQASPDHPWLKEHPGWFDWRPDGSIKYAENPPKRYEDIVNVDFYAKDAVPDLWLALRFIVLFWIEQGVRVFRVDNPHTKPFAFWRWMIEDVRQQHPDVIFLSEAFTRPKVMYHLAKLGFSQSYTYFTWRHTKAEFTAYMQELSSAPVSEFFRPHFFVNTPDINPPFLQTSGRAGFLIRAALAATLSGLWGMYSGFELCESEPLPGKEEYQDSEKYEIKPRDWNAHGNIIAEIAQLNRLRRAEPALQTHLGVSFYNAFNPNILYFAKHTPGSAHRILVAISLNPAHAEEADFEMPLWEWGLPDTGALLVHDLLRGGSFVWHGKIQHMRLTPEAPYAIWRICPAEAA